MNFKEKQMSEVCAEVGINLKTEVGYENADVL